jgi:ATP-binding cassette subfamily C protein
LRSWRRLVGYVAQDPGLYHDTILANIRLGDTSITIEMIEEALRLAEAYDFVAKRTEGINTVLGQGGMRFSGGQRKRIALARAIVRRPRLLILDEVTSALDPENEAIVCHSVRRISRDMAVLAITHRPAFLEIADNVYELNDGTLRRIDAAPLIAAAGGPTVYPVRSGLNK